MQPPAFPAGARVSPIEEANRNRAFRGRADGSVTQKIGRHFSDVLVPMAGMVVDFRFATSTGLPEPLRDLGEPVERGAPLACICAADRTGVAACVQTARRAGLPAVRHCPGLIRTGDCIAVLAVLAVVGGAGAARDGPRGRTGLSVRPPRC